MPDRFAPARHDPASALAPLPAGPCAARPLAGLTLLAVEDSRFASEALRLLAQRAGARLRRAETLAAARHHLRTYQPDVVLIDPGLPDGSGLSLVADLRSRPGPRPVCVVISGDPCQRDLAHDAGAADFLDKPVESYLTFTSTLLAHLPERGCLLDDNAAARPLPLPDPLALHDDLVRAARRLAAAPDAAEGRYLAGFVAGLARSSRDSGLERAAAGAAREPRALGDLARVLAQRLSEARQAAHFAPPGKDPMQSA